MSDLLSVSTPTGRDITPVGARARALIALLSLSPSSACSRTCLQDMLWSTRAPEQGRASLRQELSRLKRHFQKAGVEPLVVERDLVRLSPKSVRLRLKDNNPCNSDGRFLDNVDVRDPEFEDWRRMVLQARSENRLGEFLCTQLLETPAQSQMQLPDFLSSKAPLNSQQTITLAPFEFAGPDVPPMMRDLFRTSLLCLLREADFDVYETSSPPARGQSLSAVTYMRQGIEATLVLKSAPGQRVTWSRTYRLRADSGIGEVLRLCEEITLHIVKSVFASTWSRLPSWDRVSPLLRQEYLLGKRFEFSGNKLLERRAPDAFAKCLALDPDFHPAHVALGFCEIDRVRFGETPAPGRSLDMARQHFEAAASLDPESFWTRCLGIYVAFFSGEQNKSISKLRQLINTAPFDPEKAAYLATLLGHHGDLSGQLDIYDSIDQIGHDSPNWADRGRTCAAVLTDAPDAEDRVRKALSEEGPNEANLVSLLLLFARSGQLQLANTCASQLQRRFMHFDALKWAQRYRHGRPDLYESLVEDFSRLGL
ncbi:hypothetical protein [Phaeobacter sp. B1627]|uniref:hypothetical protein n=1 Tax=Phaeobacter sp. B1627 TaxID=2583809 RepID=UPI001119BC49|nr:hypothetical protein [Phaeobacter sp. B1627]TNJ38755.1 hypothetical protein FGE21_19485 [Phaeobacter sp. B1627]